MTKTDDMQWVDRLLTEAAESPAPALDPAFVTRLLADAARLQVGAPGGAAVKAVARPARRAPGRRLAGPATTGWPGGWLSGLCDVFGGPAALAGVMAATIVGLFLGIAQPGMLSGVTTAVYGETPLASLDLMAGSDSLWTGTRQ